MKQKPQGSEIENNTCEVLEILRPAATPLWNSGQ